MTETRTPDEVIAKPAIDAPAGAVITSAVVVYEYVMPGEDGEDERGPFLVYGRDTIAGKWTHLGMLQTVINDWLIDMGASSRP
jgi:hypothetical protein